MKRINIGCGQTPTHGWYNYDNSFSIRIARYPILAKLLMSLGILNKHQMGYIEYVLNNNILWADATKCIPVPDESIDVIYTSHMIEHLDRDEVKLFLSEAYRVLVHGGIIRVVVPDIKKQVSIYNENNDADVLIDHMYLSKSKNKTLLSKFIYLFVGDRHHKWMYDGASLARLLSSAGFMSCTVQPAGSTIINDPGELNLREREDESVYVEAIRGCKPRTSICS